MRNPDHAAGSSAADVSVSVTCTPTCRAWLCKEAVTHRAARIVFSLSAKDRGAPLRAGPRIVLSQLLGGETFRSKYLTIVSLSQLREQRCGEEFRLVINPS